MRFAGWMIGIGAFSLCGLGLLLLLVNFDQATLAEAGITRGAIQLVGFCMLALGLLEFLLIYALWDGSNVARIIASALIGLSLAGALVQAISGSPAATVAMLQIVISIAILVGLWGSPSASEFFRSPGAAALPPTAPPPPPPRPI